MDGPDETVMRGVALRGRGAAQNGVGRYEARARLAVDDGWDAGEARVLRTETRDETARTAISYNTSPDLPFDRSINPYRGCEHGCSYCYARPSHAYLNMSAGLDFESRLIARPNIADVLARELSAKSYAPAPIAIGTNTDPYQPIEADYRLMPQILAVLMRARHPLGITTKGALITRDVDALAPLAAEGLLRVGISITTLDPDLSRKLEPRAPSPAHRLRAIAALAQAGIPVRVMVAPVIPALSDHELEVILAAAKKAGAVAASYITLRLPREVSPLFQDWLARCAGGQAGKVMARVREMQGGQDYDPAFGKRMRGTGPWADLLAQRFTRARLNLGLAHHLPALDCSQFQPPLGQMSLL
jgi:DNA repair photolyase